MILQNKEEEHMLLFWLLHRLSRFLFLTTYLAFFQMRRRNFLLCKFFFKTWHECRKKFDVILIKFTSRQFFVNVIPNFLRYKVQLDDDEIMTDMNDEGGQIMGKLGRAKLNASLCFFGFNFRSQFDLFRNMLRKRSMFPKIRYKNSVMIFCELHVH